MNNVAPAPRGIFIHGISPRCGTNYLRWILACHRGVQVSPSGIWEFPHLSLADGLETYAQGLSASPKIVGLDRGDILAAVGKGILELAHRGLAIETRVLLKEPSVRGISGFFDYFPTSHLVIIVRDGRDVSSSLARTTFGDLPLRWYRRWFMRAKGMAGVRAVHASAWAEASRTIIQATARAEDCWRDQCMVLRYEDLISDFDANVTQLLDRLGLSNSGFDWDAARGLAIKGSSFVGRGDPKSGLDWQGVDKASVEFAPVCRWHEWTKSEQQSYLRVAKAELQHWGYATE